ncbi:universal stress protein [Pleomorphochaeta sp. DL1XJH-081]|uniref:universal stress protein n=1 Tax=Pleomorphochaeta sp. DL1XJH-081 TaxID=3409690 RepID=UPI003BB5DF6D
MTEPFKHMLVYLDGSEDSVTAAMAAIALAKRLDASLTAMYVVNTRALQDLVKARIFLDIEEQEYRRDIEGDAQRYLNHVERMGKQKGVPVVPIKKSGTVHTEVRSYLQDNHIDLLVLGGISDIHSRRDELLSETDRMMRTAPCPVLVVKDNDTVWDMFESLPDMN